jgi:DNA-binding PadR family transcriptional regulator
VKRTSDPLGPLTPVEFHVLLSLSSGGLHGYAILQDVAQRTPQITLRTGTLYTVIKRMLDDRWIEETDKPGDDPRRRYYRLTPLGRELLRNEAKRMQELVALAQDKRVLARPRKLAPERGR